jgi:hypothetical protein
VQGKRRVCGNCGNMQGPYDRLFIGYRKTGRWIFTCKVPSRPATDKQRQDAVKACNDRREKQYASR